MHESLRDLRHPIVIAAFEGWNDAADSATEAVNHLMTAYPTELAWELDCEDYYDFQVSRPRIVLGESGRELEWPSTGVYVCHLDDRDLVLVFGPEPNLRWRSFASALVSVFRSIEPDMVILLGAMLTDAPHTRPVMVTGGTNSRRLKKRLGLESSNYEGPTGIVGVLNDACRAANLTVVSLWASVPHYAAAPPNPKATLALLARLEDILETRLDLQELPQLARSWEHGVNELATEDPDVAEYIAKLEEAHDESSIPVINGDSIAAEFERYLRRRDQS